MSSIINHEKVELPDLQLKMIESGWGSDAAYKTALEHITYLSDDLKVKGYVAYPEKVNSKLPCIVWCRGGFGNAGVIDFFNAKGMFGLLASWGYFVFAPQYRGNDGGEGKDEFGGGDVNDVLNILQAADEYEYADTSQWAIEGWSRGGMMAYLTLTKTDIFKTAVVTGGITDLRCTTDQSPFFKNLYKKSLTEIIDENFNSFCENRSIIKHYKKLPKTTSILLLHGTNDNRVPPQDSLDLSYRLLERQIPFELLLFKNGDHFLKSHRDEVDRKRKNWYQEHLTRG